EGRQGRRGRAAGRSPRLAAVAELGEDGQGRRGLLRADAETPALAMQRFILPACVLMWGATAVAQTPATAPKTGGTAAPTAAQSTESAKGLVHVTIHTSRPEVTVDGGYGVFADLENLSNGSLTLYEKETGLVVQPEVTSSGSCTYRVYAWFPTELEAPTGSTPASAAGDPRGRALENQKDERYTGFWDIRRASTTDTTCPKRGTLEWLSFVPGAYTFTVEGKVYLPNDKAGATQPYHTFTETATLKVTVPQLYAMWAAAFGGIFAYLVM